MHVPSLPPPARNKWTRRRERAPRPVVIMPWLLLLATLLMPIEYRAGSSEAHTHTIFQGVVDAITGHTHHHAGDSTDPAPGSAISPFSALTIPLSTANVASGPAEEPSLPDEPSILGLSTPILASAAILALGLLVMTLLSGGTRHPEWARRDRLQGWIPGAESPPPRAA